MQTYPRGELVLVLDCVDLDLLADFWTSALGYQRAGGIHEPYLRLVSESHPGPEVLLQRVPEGKGGKNRLHVDLRTRNLVAEVQRIRSSGASQLTDTRPTRVAGRGTSSSTLRVISSASSNRLTPTGRTFRRSSSTGPQKIADRW